jgi:hypothetical protein
LTAGLPRAIEFPSPDDGNVTSFRNVVVSKKNGMTDSAKEYS